MGKSESAVYYEENPIAYIKKKAYDTLFNRRPEQRAKRAELAKANREHDAKYGKASREGKDLSNTKHGLVYKDSSTNRGSKTDMPGDRRARG